MSPPLKWAFLTPGTGSWYCGACIRDNALAKSLLAAGHPTSLLPMYLPLQLDEPLLAGSSGTPVFFGGINVFLHQQTRWFRHTPSWLSRSLDHPTLLRTVARHSSMTSPATHGEITLAMLRLEESQLQQEIHQLLNWLANDPPNILVLSTALQAGMIRTLKDHLNLKIITCFQGEDAFLDGLPQPHRETCWHELASRIRESDALTAPSAFYANLMRSRLNNPSLPITPIPNGIPVADFHPPASRPQPPVIGFLARLCHSKGLELMVDAFIHLRTTLGHPNARLHLAGATTPPDLPLIHTLQQRLANANLTHETTWQSNISREEKIAMLSTLSLFSVPAIVPEAGGLYVLEAMAAGVPVVLPNTGSFPEILATSHTGKLVPPNNPAALAGAWHDLLSHPAELEASAHQSRRAAERCHDVANTRDHFIALARHLTAHSPN